MTEFTPLPYQPAPGAYNQADADLAQLRNFDAWSAEQRRRPAQQSGGLIQSLASGLLYAIIVKAIYKNRG